MEIYVIIFVQYLLRSEKVIAFYTVGFLLYREYELPVDPKNVLSKPISSPTHDGITSYLYFLCDIFTEIRFMSVMYPRFSDGNVINII